jgi:3-hydroxybutyrate dehydrogenase
MAVEHSRQEEGAAEDGTAGRLLEGRVAIVTGAAGGLGRALVALFEHEGAAVLPVDLAGDDVWHADVGTAEGTQAMVREALTCHGRLDTLILNAGAQYVAPIPEHTEEAWDRLNDIMVKGPFLALRAAWGELTGRPGGRVVVTASGSSYIAEKYKAAYVAAKHGVLGLVKVGALEGGPVGLTVNAVAPGWMRTPMVEDQLADQMRLHNRTREEVIASFVTRHPVDRFVETDEVAQAVAFLASDRASGINGVCLPVDLGTLVW